MKFSGLTKQNKPNKEKTPNQTNKKPKPQQPSRQGSEECWQEAVKSESVFPVIWPHNQNSPKCKVLTALFFFSSSSSEMERKAHEHGFQCVRHRVQLHCEWQDGRTGTGRAGKALGMRWAVRDGAGLAVKGCHSLAVSDWSPCQNSKP